MTPCCQFIFSNKVEVSGKRMDDVRMSVAKGNKTEAADENCVNKTGMYMVCVFHQFELVLDSI